MSTDMQIFEQAIWLCILSFFYILVFGVIITKKCSKNVCLMLILILIGRMAWSVLKYYYKLPPAFSDEVYFEIAITDNAKHGLSKLNLHPRTDVNIYLYAHSIITILSGGNAIGSILFNAFLGTLAIYNIGRISAIIGDERIAVTLAAISPAMLIYTTNLLRESFVLYFITLAILYGIKYLDSNGGKSSIFTFFLYAILAAMVRKVNLPIFLCMGLFLIYLGPRGRKRGAYRIVLMGSLVLAAAILIKTMYSLQGVSVSIDWINGQLMRDKITGGNPYLVGLRYNSWIDVVRYLPLRLFYFMLHPFPWVLSNYRTLAAVLASLYDLVLISILVLRAKVLLRASRIDNRVRFVIWCFLFGMCVYAVVKTEAAVRHRLQFMWMLPILVSTLFRVHESPRVSRRVEGK